MDNKRADRSSPDQSWRIGGIIMRSRLFRGCLAFTVLGIFYLSLFLSNQHVNVFSVVGGIAGLISTVIVVTGYSSSGKKTYSTLFWRAMCDLGVALRFILVPAFNYYTCGDSVCSYTDSNENLCQLPSAILQFFLLASEMWFFCHGLDLYFTVNNPFSSYESRAWKYHFFTWGVALFITIFPYMSETVHTVYGFWYISDIDSNGNTDYPVCWIKIHSETYLGWPIFVLFFMPLAFVYLFCLMTVILAYVRLRKGLTQSFLPRVKLLVTSISNIVVLILFWGVAMMIYGLTYQLRNDKQASDRTFNILMFMIASKAFSSLVVAINQVETYKKDDSLSGIEGDDANTALREEVLSFATTGIKNTAMSDATKDTAVFTRQPRLNNYRSTNNLVTPWFFFRLLFDHDGEGLRAVKDMIDKNKRTMHATSQVPGLVLSEEETKSLLNSQVSVDDGSRLSQRSTLTTNPSTTHSPFLHQQNPSFIAAYPPTVSMDSGGSSSNPSFSHPHQQIRRSSAGSTSGGLFREHGNSEIRVGSEMASFVSMKQSDMVDIDAIKNSTVAAPQSWRSRMYTSVLQPVISLFENDKVEFKELQPYFFQKIRRAYGISKELYAEEFSKSIKQRMTEGGASGAFFFFSKTDKFVGKSCTEEEMEVLVQNAESYSDYMTTNRNTFICKIYGVYELRIYNEVLYFFVMNNLFLNEDGLTMNEKYDLKGSWVARNSAPPREGQTFSCTYCERKFVYRKKKRSNKSRTQQSSLQRMNSNTSDTAAVDEAGVEAGAGRGNSKNGPIVSYFASLFTSTGSNSNSSSSSSSSPKDSSGKFAASAGTANVASKPKKYSDNEPRGVDSVELRELSVDAHGVSHLTNVMAISDYGDDDRCPFTTGEHFPNVIMKDNDIKHKIRLTELESAEVQSQLRLDAEFLTSLGIMDYSLLVGVHLAEYEVDMTGDLEGAPAGMEGTSPKTGRGKQSPTDDAIGGSGPVSLSMSNRQRSFVRRTGTMSSKRNVDSIVNISTVNANVATDTASMKLAAKAAELVDLESGVDSSNGGGGGGVGVDGDHLMMMMTLSEQSAAARMTTMTSSGDSLANPNEYKLTRKLAVHKIIGPDAYFMGIIDFQQRWNFSKQMERFFKIFFKGADPEGLSAIEPIQYKERFLRKIEDILEQETTVRNYFK